MPENTPPQRLSRAAKIVLWFGVVVLPLVLFILLEGTSSLLLAIRDLMSYEQRQLAERTHTRYDQELGWVNIPNTTVPNLYGPGRSLQINGQGFRNRDEVSWTVPAGRTRIVCSGDSFTLGYGVDDDETWCHLLSTYDPRIEAVNMGQGGYGIDQAYLWYRRDAARLDHQVHIFAYISNDFRRMRSAVFRGYPKPVLRMRDGQFTVENVPVPRRPFYAAWLPRWESVARPLRTSELLLDLRERWGPGDPSQPEVRGPAPDSTTWELTRAIFQDLVALNRAKHSRLVVVHLPTGIDHQGEGANPWRERASRAAAELGFTFVDLIEPFRQLPPETVSPMFIQQDIPGVIGARGHYTRGGNEWVARKLGTILAGDREAVREPASR